MRNAVFLLQANAITATLRPGQSAVFENLSGTSTLKSDNQSVTQFIGINTVHYAIDTLLPGEVIFGYVDVNYNFQILSDNYGPPFFPKLASVPAAPGAGLATLFITAGTTAGTCALKVIAGTSTTPVLLADNIGGQC
jgi:hypothetical protein